MRIAKTLIAVGISLVLTNLACVQSSLHAQSSRFKTLGYRSCGTGQGNCHSTDYKWWQTDPHFKTVSDLKRKKQNAMRYAQLYGMNPNDYLKGSSGCAKCHGEVVSSRMNKNINSGVSCESCHGPSGPKNSGYLDVHQEGTDPASKPGATQKDKLDTSRKGYRAALRVGLLELRNVKVRAKQCVTCHYITEKKLLATGHPSGEGFDYIDGIRNSIAKHWDYKPRKSDFDSAPYASEIQRRGPVPAVNIINLRAPGGGGTRNVTVIRYKDPELPGILNPTEPVSLAPFNPKITSSTPVDSILLRIKTRIEYIHNKLGKK